MKKKGRRHALPKSWREKKRYLFVRVESSGPVSPAQAHRALFSTMESLFGRVGIASIHPVLVSFDEQSKSGVLRIHRDHLNKVRVALAFVSSVFDAPARVRILRVSGSIKGLKSNFVKIA